MSVTATISSDRWPASPSVPDHRLEDEHHARLQHKRRVEVGAEIGADERHLGAVGADPVCEIEVRQPRARAVRPCPRRARGRPRSTPGRTASSARSTTSRQRANCSRSTSFGARPTIHVAPKSDAYPCRLMPVSTHMTSPVRARCGRVGSGYTASPVRCTAVGDRPRHHLEHRVDGVGGRARARRSRARNAPGQSVARAPGTASGADLAASPAR